MKGLGKYDEAQRTGVEGRDSNLPPLVAELRGKRGSVMAGDDRARVVHMRRVGGELKLVCLRMEGSNTSLGVLATPYRELDLYCIAF